MKKNRTLLIIPAFNEEDSLESVFKELEDYTELIDYIVINDGSSDNTLEVCQKNNVNVIDLPVNLGLTGAFETGIKYAKEHSYDIAIQFDADGQHTAESIPSLINEIDKGFSLVIGSRFVIEKKPISLRMIGSFLISTAIFISTGKKIKDPTSGLRAFDKDLINLYLDLPNMTPEPDTVSYFLKNKIKITEVQVSMRERIAGESYLNFSRSIKYMLRMAVSILIIQPFRKRIG